MTSIKLAYMPQDNNMVSQYFQEPNLPSSSGAKSLWNTAPPATPQSSSASMSSVWGSPIPVLQTSSATATPVAAATMGKSGAIASAAPFRSHSSSSKADTSSHPSLAALAAESEPVVHPVSSMATFAPSLSSASSRLSSRQNSQTDITSPATYTTSTGSASVSGAHSATSPSLMAAKPSSNAGSFANDEIINTAIVVKNIPFAIKKEQLIDFMTQLGLPLPYAFNYHFDNGVFRGLAFANFTTADETAVVISSLNGRELGGRKLRVEYKKMLPFQERERIEREKRERRGQLEEQHQQVSAAQSKAHSNSHNNAQAAHIQNLATSSDARQPVEATVLPNASVSPPSANQPLAVVDMNDPEVLQTYSTLLLFKWDRNQEKLDLGIEHVYEFSPSQIDMIQVLARRLDLHLELSDGGLKIKKRMDPIDGERYNYRSGLFEHAVLLPSSHPIDFMKYPPTLRSALNNYNAMSRWNSASNLVSLGSNVKSDGSSLPQN